MCKECEDLRKAIEEYIEKADNKLSAKLRAKGFIKPKDTLSTANTLDNKITSALSSQNKAVLDLANNSKDLKSFKNKFDKFKSKDMTEKEISEAIENSYNKFMPKLIDGYLKQNDKGLSFISVSEKTSSWVKEWSKDLAEKMKLSSHEGIEKILIRNLDEGNGIEDFVREFQDSGLFDERSRARTTAVTEALRAHSVAHDEARMQNPSVSQKMWRHTGEYKIQPRENHEDMDGQTVPKEEPFELTGADGGTYYPMYPRDPILPPEESINCHCICQDVVDEDVSGLSLEERQALQQQALDDMDDEWEEEFNDTNRGRAGIE